jgi:hypothetical protein
MTLHARPAPQVKRPSAGEPERPRLWAVRFLQLEPDGCRWPIGVDGYGARLFCNIKKGDGRMNYCEAHHREAIDP